MIALNKEILRVGQFNEDLFYIFRSYDIRGVYGSVLTPETMFHIGVSLSNFLQSNKKSTNKTIYVARDIRQSGSTLQNALISGITAMGFNVLSSPIKLPFGASMFSGWIEKCDVIAFITASHLDATHNGVKFYYGNGIGFAEEDNLKIRDNFFQIHKKPVNVVSWDKTGNVEYLHNLEKYIEFMQQNFKLPKPTKIVTDCGNGSISLISSELFSKLGFNSIELFCDPDPSFPNRSPEPTPESLKMLAERVIKESAEFGVGFDGDGDRAIIIDDKGRFISADKLAAIISKLLIEPSSSKTNIIANVECSLLLEESLKDLANIHRIKVGHTFMTKAANDISNVLLGVESSGHMVFPKYFLFDDAVLIPLVLARAIQGTNQPLSGFVDELPKSYIKRTAINCSDSIKFQMINLISEKIKADGLKINDIDGVRIEFKDNSWVLIRASNTAPKIRIVVESLNKSRTDDLFKKFKNLLEEIIDQYRSRDP